MGAKEDAKQAAIRKLASQFKNLNSNDLETYIILQAVAEKVRLQMEDSLQKLQMTRARFIPLAMLFMDPEHQLQPSVLAEHAGVTRATMTGILDVLESAKWIQRVNNSEDRRALKIELTKEGEKLMRKVLPQHFQLVSKIMNGISDSERRAMASIFKKIEANIEEMD